MKKLLLLLLSLIILSSCDDNQIPATHGVAEDLPQDSIVVLYDLNYISIINFDNRDISDQLINMPILGIKDIKREKLIEICYIDSYIASKKNYIFLSYNPKDKFIIYNDIIYR